MTSKNTYDNRRHIADNTHDNEVLNRRRVALRAWYYWQWRLVKKLLDSKNRYEQIWNRMVARLFHHARLPTCFVVTSTEYRDRLWIQPVAEVASHIGKPLRWIRWLLGATGFDIDKASLRLATVDGEPQRSILWNFGEGDEACSGNLWIIYDIKN
jgi:hypothetical protein